VATGTTPLIWYAALLDLSSLARVLAVGGAPDSLSDSSWKDKTKNGEEKFQRCHGWRVVCVCTFTGMPMCGADSLQQRARE
jgi:hypothetical protein